MELNPKRSDGWSFFHGVRRPVASSLDSCAELSLARRRFGCGAQDEDSGVTGISTGDLMENRDPHRISLPVRRVLNAPATGILVFCMIRVGANHDPFA